MNELSGDVDAWLTSTLKGDETLAGLVKGVYGYLAPKGAEFPHVLFNQQSSQDENAIDGTPGATRFVYQIKVVGQDSGFAALTDAVTRIYELLHKQTGTSGETKISSCTKQSGIKYPHLGEGGVRYSHFGSLYLIWAQNA